MARLGGDRKWGYPDALGCPSLLHFKIVFHTLFCRNKVRVPTAKAGSCPRPHILKKKIFFFQNVDFFDYIFLWFKRFFGQRSPGFHCRATSNTNYFGGNDCV